MRRDGHHPASQRLVFDPAARLILKQRARNPYQPAGSGDTHGAFGHQYLDRFDESLPILLEQAKVLQPDAMSWFQVGVAYAHLGQAEQAIDAFHRAVTLDPEYAAAMFELGGVHWNSGDHAKAKQTWSVACERFPDHELVSQVKALLQ
ncbi:tetratricopeptide repeat protein [Paraburkholderia hayleyella]|uniref:tetratricopeptide repeat protein n=1 Tax=Paraburkholderia hayleyella TaxID=2152889 RepID=UPI001FEA075C|nr:tetratricopeptide repeat protein [Paraburkholderia hayleyella]